VSEWKHFSEVDERMEPDFMERLIKLRKTINVPLTVTSSYRDREHNSRIGGAVNSAHLLGRAVDIKIAGENAYTLVGLAVVSGFTGIGVKQKGPYGGRFIHLDDCEDCADRPRPRIWSY